MSFISSVTLGDDKKWIQRQAKPRSFELYTARYSRTTTSSESKEIMSTSTPGRRTRAPNLKQKALISILKLHNKESASKSIKQGWMTKDEEKRALDRLGHFLKKYREDNTHHSTLPHTNKEAEPINIMCMDGGGMRGRIYLLLYVL